MPRRALIATIVTATVGALMGVVFGAIVGRVIALFGDETVQTSVPMIFCATLGFFVGGASTIKGSLERFGAKRAGAGTFVALVVLVLLVGGVSVMGQAAVIVVVAALVALVVASAAAVAVAAPNNVPRHGINAPRGARPAPDAEVTPVASVRERVPVPVRRVAVDPSPARRAATQDWEPEDEAVRTLTDEELADWTREDETPVGPPREAARPRRDRPLSRADLTRPAPSPTRPAAKKAAPAKTAATTVKHAPASKSATKTAAAASKAPAKKAAVSPKKAAPAKKTAAAAKKAPAKKTAAATKSSRTTKKGR